MAQTVGYVDVAARNISIARPRSGHFIMAAVLLSLGFFMVWPVALVQ
jgi:hypothetical protein